MFDFNYDVEILSHRRGVYVIKDLKKRRNEKVNTKKHHCIEDNSQLFTKCMNNFIMERLNCRLPWLQVGGYTGNYHNLGVHVYGSDFGSNLWSMQFWDLGVILVETRDVGRECGSIYIYEQY
jgi:hypothetical protein